MFNLMFDFFTTNNQILSTNVNGAIVNNATGAVAVPSDQGISSANVTSNVPEEPTTVNATTAIGLSSDMPVNTALAAGADTLNVTDVVPLPTGVTTTNIPAPIGAAIPTTSYDLNGSPITTIVPATLASSITTISYDVNGSPITHVVPITSSPGTTDALGQTTVLATSLASDGVPLAANATSSSISSLTSVLTDAPGLPAITSTSYDINGTPITTAIPDSVNASSISGITDAMGQTAVATSLGPDGLSIASAASTGPDGLPITTDPSAPLSSNISSVTALAAGAVSSVSYGIDGQPITTIAAPFGSGVIITTGPDGLPLTTIVSSLGTNTITITGPDGLLTTVTGLSQTGVITTIGPDGLPLTIVAAPVGSNLFATSILTTLPASTAISTGADGVPVTMVISAVTSVVSGVTGISTAGVSGQVETQHIGSTFANATTDSLTPPTITTDALGNAIIIEPTAPITTGFTNGTDGLSTPVLPISTSTGQDGLPTPIFPVPISSQAVLGYTTGTDGVSTPMTASATSFGPDGLPITVVPVPIATGQTSGPITTTTIGLDGMPSPLVLPLSTSYDSNGLPVTGIAAANASTSEAGAFITGQDGSAVPGTLPVTFAASTLPPLTRGTDGLLTPEVATSTVYGIDGLPIPFTTGSSAGDIGAFFTGPDGISAPVIPFATSINTAGSFTTGSDGLSTPVSVLPVSTSIGIDGLPTPVLPLSTMVTTAASTSYGFDGAPILTVPSGVTSLPPAFGSDGALLPSSTGINGAEAFTSLVASGVSAGPDGAYTAWTSQATALDAGQDGMANETNPIGVPFGASTAVPSDGSVDPNNPALQFVPTATNSWNASTSWSESSTWTTDTLPASTYPGVPIPSYLSSSFYSASSSISSFIPQDSSYTSQVSAYQDPGSDATSAAESPATATMESAIPTSDGKSPIMLRYALTIQCQPLALLSPNLPLRQLCLTR